VTRDLTDWNESRWEELLVNDASDATRGGCCDEDFDGETD